MKIVVTCEIKEPDSRNQGPRLDRPWDIHSEHLSVGALTEICSALVTLGHEVEIASSHERLIELNKTYPNLLCVNLSVGYGGVSTKVHTAALLEILGIPYVGSPPHALVITRDKAVSKAVALSAGIKTPPWQILYPGDRAVTEIEPPLIVKPIHESCSIGIHAGSVIRDRRHLSAVVSRVWNVYGQAAIIEQYIPGFDIEVPFINEMNILGFAGVVPRFAQQECDILTAAAVYRDAYNFISPKEIVPWSTRVEDQLRSWVLTFVKATGIRDYGRMDFRMTPAGEPFFIEASTHPYLARHSSFAWLYQKAGHGYEGLWRDLLAVPRLRYETGMICSNA